jgi:hypothetical protein
VAGILSASVASRQKNQQGQCEDIAELDRGPDWGNATCWREGGPAPARRWPGSAVTISW